jgi:la-related protein 1
VNHRTGSSGPSSPPLVVQPHLQPRPSAIDLNVSPSNTTYLARRYNQVGVQTSEDLASSRPPSIPRQHSTPQIQQSYYHPTAHVPMPLQRSGYPRGTPPLPPAHYLNPGASHPIYSPYAAYNYHNSATHHGFWNTNQSHPGSGTHSPAYTQSQAGLLYYLTHFALTYPRQPQPQPHPPPRSGVLPRPEQSQAVAGYKEVAVGKEYSVVFGSIGIPGASQSPSPAPLPSRNNYRKDGADRGQDKGEDEKAFTFSIGVTPGDGPSRSWARTVSFQACSRTGMASTSESELKTAGEMEISTPTSAESKIIDLTDSQELKWEFGTTTSSLPVCSRSRSISSENLRVGTGASHTLPPVLNSITGFGVHSGIVYRSTSGSPVPPVEGAVLSARLRDVASGDDFEVKDFGYGFGPASGTGRAPVITREQREERERENWRERERMERERMERERMEREEREREKMELELQRDQAEAKDHEYERDREKKTFRDMDVPVHPRRGSYNGGVGYDRGERGSRRGRGMNGFGRGYHNRRGGGFQQHIPQQQQQRPFTLTPPQAVVQPLQTVSDPSNGYYPQHRPPYVPPGYEAYLPPTASPTASHTSPPVPVPVTTLSFPLDPTRWYLLGQLEYYLSPQNMAQDFYLRQQVLFPFSFV